ncbi:MAG: YajQ family cyclic di-GMP-binding protein [Actinobacteria bacterium]|nr:YajQ family cyclic di-GMP-binding protein [Actinomycetota bacterium]
MAKESSFDIVSQVNFQEVDNAVNQTKKEIQTRYDFKNTDSMIVFEAEEIEILTSDEYKLKSIIDVLQSKMVKRDVSLKSLDYGKVEEAAKGRVRQKIGIVSGVSSEKAREINKFIKTLGIKVNTQVEGDKVRVSGKNKDDIQAVIKNIKEKDFGIPLQFINYR